jgi:hypothetical protein
MPEKRLLLSEIALKFSLLVKKITNLLAPSKRASYVDFAFSLANKDYANRN